MIGEITWRVPGTAYKVELRAPHSARVVAEAFKESLLRRDPELFEREAYFLSGLHKNDVSENAVLVFI